MGRDTVTANKSELDIARSATYMRLKETTKLIEIFGSLASAIEECGLADFIDNNVECTAQDRAWVRYMENLLRDKLHGQITEACFIEKAKSHGF